MVCLYDGVGVETIPDLHETEERTHALRKMGKGLIRMYTHNTQDCTRYIKTTRCASGYTHHTFLTSTSFDAPPHRLEPADGFDTINVTLNHLRGSRVQAHALRWHMQLANGTYKCRIAVGDPSFPSKPRL